MAISAQRLPWRPPSTRHPGGAGAHPVYRPRQPAASALYAVVQHHIETFLAHAAEADPVGYGVPTGAPPRAMRALRGDPWVEKDFRDHASRGARLRCGILAYGFARAGHPPKVGRDACSHERLIAFSCKGRGICPSCNARRMAELAAHLTDHVLPHLPARGHRLRSKWSGTLRPKAPSPLPPPQSRDRRGRPRDLPTRDPHHAAAHEPGRYP